MTIVTTTVAVNAAFLQEIKQDNQELQQLLARVNELCQRHESPPECRQELADLLVRLRDRLAMHFALEEAYGYFDDSVVADPRLSRRADKLRGEHGRLFSQLNTVVESALEKLNEHSPRYVCGRISRAFRAFHAALQRHEQQENELILEAFEQDVGVGD